MVTLNKTSPAHMGTFVRCSWLLREMQCRCGGRFVRFYEANTSGPKPKSDTGCQYFICRRQSMKRHGGVSFVPRGNEARALKSSGGRSADIYLFSRGLVCGVGCGRAPSPARCSRCEPTAPVASAGSTRPAQASTAARSAGSREARHRKMRGLRVEHTGRQRSQLGTWEV